MSVSTETYVRGLSRTRQFSSVPTFWLLDCRINRCVERMDTCGEHTYFNVPLSFSFIYNAVSFVVSRMFPSPPFPRPWSFLSKKPEGRSRGMTEVARLRDTKNFDQRLCLLPRSRRFNEEILLFNGGVKMKYRKRIFQELQLYGIPRVSSYGRFTGEKFNDEIFSQLYQPIYTLIGRVSSKFQKPNRPRGISIIRVSARYPTSTFHVASDDPTCTRRRFESSTRSRATSTTDTAAISSSSRYDVVE